ncbi:Hypothetical predicted protein [Marmota monax]|uniref:Alpha-2-macroglobulin domain-containing protein n=1 Tax=Marmota monax TaxID=9995 RepID=A0A5E4BU07_MARMO|nr:Hypothetical predicted protein [Marmota monax]
MTPLLLTRPRQQDDLSGEETLSLQVPDSITSWVGEAVGLSTSRGLGIAEPALLKTFKPFFLDFTLPPLVVRGEQVKVPLSVYNYLGTCAEVPTPQMHGFSYLLGEQGRALLQSGCRGGMGPG